MKYTNLEISNSTLIVYRTCNRFDVYTSIALHMI